MKNKKLWAILLLSMIASSAAIAGKHSTHHARTKPCPRCSIPKENYQFRPRSQTKVLDSRTGVLLKSAVATTNAIIQELATATNINKSEIQKKQPRVDMYQLPQAKIKIDQCSISQVAIQLQNNGDWTLSLRADQNAAVADTGDVSVYNPRLYINRNQFVISLRCLGNDEAPATERAKEDGKPVLAELGPIRFWVENGQPKFVRYPGNSDLIKQYFDDIDRVELEFYYR